MNKILIRFVLLFSSLWQKLGVDTAQLEIILVTKLKMDDRRPNMYMAGRQQSKKPSKHSSWLSLVFLVIMGAFLTTILAISGNPMIGHTFFFSMFMVLIALTLISDFTSVLIDVRDNYIILPRPVNDVTFTVSRILHITIHVSKLVLGLALPAIIYQFFFVGIIAGIVFIIEVLSASVLSIFLVNMVYLIVLKVTSAEKFKSFISYFQIVFSVIIFAAYQLLPRLVNSDFLNNFDILSYKVSYLLPPVWFAAFYDVLLNQQAVTVEKLLLALVGIIMPFLSLIVVIKYLAPGFNKKLSGISGSSSEAAPVISGKAVIYKPSLASKISKVLSSDPVEQAGFKLTWWLTSRYRDFKVKVYPSFAYVPVYFLYFGLMKQKGAMADKIQSFKYGSGYIFLTYLTSFVVLTVLQQVTQAEKFKAAWVLFSTPHNKPGKILSGMFKALMLKYFVPFYLVITVFSLWFWGPKVINDLVFAFFNILIYALIMCLFTVKYLPFSQPINTNKQGGKVFVNLLLFSIIGIFGFSHYALSRWEWLITGLTIVSAGITIVIFYYFQKRDWEALEADYS